MAGFFKDKVAVAGLAFAVIVAVSAGPAPRVEAQVVSESMKVRFQDLDLGNRRDVDRLVARVGAAALEMCGASPFSLREFKAAVSRSQCWRDGVADAIKRIGDPRLTAAFGRQPALASGGSGIMGPPPRDLQ